MKRLSECPSFMVKSYVMRSNPVVRNILIKKYKTALAYYRAQRGGSINCIKVEYNSEVFEFHEYEEDLWVLSDKEDRDCVNIGVDPENREAYINNINADTTKCGNTILTNQGSHLFKITLQFLREHRERLKVDRILITDNAEKHCPGQSRRIALAPFLTLLTGHTWYGKYGFMPRDEAVRRDYNLNNDIMRTTRLSDVDFDVIIRELTACMEEGLVKGVQHRYFIEQYEKNKGGNPLVKDLLRTIFDHSNYDFICSVFILIQGPLDRLLGLSFANINNQVYELDL